MIDGLYCGDLEKKTKAAIKLKIFRPEQTAVMRYWGDTPCKGAIIIHEEII